MPEREQLHRGPDPANFDRAACAAWIWGQLLGEQRTEGGRVRTLLEDGVREVEGTPPAWYGYPTWSDYDLRGKIRDLGSHRALFVRRENHPKEQAEWLANEGAQQELRRCIQAVLSHVYERHEEVRKRREAISVGGLFGGLVVCVSMRVCVYFWRAGAVPGLPLPVPPAVHMCCIQPCLPHLLHLRHSPASAATFFCCRSPSSPSTARRCAGSCWRSAPRMSPAPPRSGWAPHPRASSG